MSQPLHLPVPIDPTRRRLLAATATAFGLSACAIVPAPAPSRIPAFSQAGALDIIPPGWQSYALRQDLPRTDYRTAALNGRRVLRAGGAGVSSGLRCPVRADVDATPWLRWQWQVDGVPAGMCVCQRDADDSPARVVVAFDGDHSTLPLRDRAFFDFVELMTGERLPYATLMFVWDARLPVGTVVPYARTSRIRYLVVESGEANAGRWLACERDLRADFRAVFGEPPGPLTAVGVLTDSDDLQVPVNAWYGDLTLSAT